MFRLQVQLFSDLTLRILVGAHIRTFIVLHGYFSLGKTSGPTTKALAVRFYSRWYYVGSGVGVSARRIGSAMNKFIPSRPKFSEQNTCILLFLKVPTKLFVAQKIDLEDT